MTEVAATYFDGRTSQARPVVLRFSDDGTLALEGVGVSRVFARAEVRVDSRLGNVSRFVRLPEDQRCEVTDNDALDAALARWAPQRAGAWLHRVEQSWRWVLISTVVLAALGWAAIRFGLPWGARHVAMALPAGLTRQLGDETLAALDKAMFEPSQLPQERRAELQAKFAAFLGQVGDAFPYRIEFRRGEGLGANAFALPSGAIVMTDELIELAGDDAEILGVLAHECGHVQHRHALRAVLQNSAVFVVIAFVTGDVSSATGFAGALPTFLLQNKFSREFEGEADAYAVQTLRRAGLPPSALATMLERLEESHRNKAGGLKVLDYLSTHPPTPERVQAITGDGL